MPLQLPVVALSVEPSSSVPLTTGTAVLTGGAAWAGAVWAEPLCALPPTLVAVTATWMTWSMSPATSV